ncbi:MAG: hypothetical protein ACRERV_13860 [Methylococcales bacterium]
MSRLNIDRMSLRLHGISSDVAQAALDGLDAEIVRRLQIRGLDASALSGLSSNLRLPTIQSSISLDAESLRKRIADGIMSFLSPEATTNRNEKNTGEDI